MDEQQRDTIPHINPTIGDDEAFCPMTEVEIAGEKPIVSDDIAELDLFPAPIGDFGNEERSSRPSREPVDRTSLELKLNGLIEEMRCELEVERAAAAEVEVAPVHIAGFCPPTSHETAEQDAPKIIVRDIMDPRAELTIVGRRADDDAAWLLDGVDEDGPTNPLFPPLVDDFFSKEKKEDVAPKRKRRSFFVLAPVALFGAVVTWLVMSQATFSAAPTREFVVPTGKPQNEPSIPSALVVTELPRADEKAADAKGIAPPNAPATVQNDAENGNTSRPRNARSRKNKPVVVLPPGRVLPPKAPIESNDFLEALPEPKRKF